MNSIFRRIDITSNLIFMGAWLACIGACTLTAFLSVTASFTFIAPEALGDRQNQIMVHVVATTFLISAPVTFFFLFLIRHMNSLNLKLGHRLRHDDLTGILSRDAFMSDFGKDSDGKTEYRKDALLLIDADYFKQINDTYGHGVGDRALVTISNALYKSVRGTDKVGRIGGEEFAIHLRNVSVDLAELIADRIRANVKRAARKLDIPDLKLSVSIGLVSYEDNQDLKNLMFVADKLLYQAKESGRDRVESTYIEPDKVAA